MKNKKPLIVGITGGTGAGKTRLLKQLASVFRDEITFISEDNYYKEIFRQVKDENGITNFDLPHSIDHELLLSHLQKLKAGESVTMKEYTFNQVHAAGAELHLLPAPIIAVEGIFVLYEKTLRNELNVKVFIDAPEALRFKRRLRRDMNERGCTEEEVKYHFYKHARPVFETLLSPLRTGADIILHNKGNGEMDIEELVKYIEKKRN